MLQYWTSDFAVTAVASNECTCGTFYLKVQYHHNQSRLSTEHGTSAPVKLKDEHSDWKLLAHLCSSNSNMTLSCVYCFQSLIKSKTSTPIPCPVDRNDNIIDWKYSICFVTVVALVIIVVVVYMLVFYLPMSGHDDDDDDRKPKGTMNNL